MSIMRQPGEAGNIQPVFQDELPATDIIAYCQDTEPILASEASSPSLFDRLRNKWTTIGAVVLAGLLLAEAPGFENPAHAANTKQATVGMPFGGNWAYVNKVNPPYTDSNSSHPSVHNSYSFQWATDLYAASDTEVKVYGSSSQGTVTFKRSGTSDTCSSYGENIAGWGVTFDVLVEGSKIGQVKYDHLDLTDVGNDPIASGTKIGEITTEPLNASCYQVSHAHVQFKNTVEGQSCYVDHGETGKLLAAGTNLGVLGSNNTTAKQACTETPGGGGAAPPDVADGTFLKVNESNAIYRVVGGAPIRIYNQGAIPDFNGGQVVSITHAQLGQMPTYPKDEGDIISLVEAGGAKYRFVGGAPVRIYNCATIPDNCAGAFNVNFQSLVDHDHMRQRPTDGAAISIAESGGSGVYRFVGGAPIRLFNWGAIPNLTTISVNEQSLATHDHMNTRPADGAAISLAEAGGSGIYRFVGGAPIRLFNWGAIPDMPNPVTVNAQSLTVYDHMNERPADGSAINLVEAGGSGIYRFAGGAPLRLFNWGGIPGFGNAVNVNAQSLAVHDHMNTLPANGNFIASAETGVVYRVAGGSALRLYNHGGIPGFNGAVFVNQQTLDTLDHLLATPSNGTVLRGVSSGTYWQINNGERTQIGANGNAVVVDEQTISAFPIDQ